MRHAADVPELQEDPPARRVHGPRRELPAFDLNLRPDAGGIGVAGAHRGHDRCFGEDEAGRCPLGVVLRHQRIRHAVVDRTATRERRHDDAVRKNEIADGEGIEKSGHRV